MPIVLAIEPDLRQAAIIKRIVRDKVLADVVVVETRDAALEAIRKGIPDVLLLSALLSPRDEDELIAHLRLLDGAEHLQTHTIPQLAGTPADREAGRSRGLFGLFGRKKDKEESAAGCDPDLFAEEIRAYLERAHEKKEERKFLLEQGIEIETPGPLPSPQARHVDAAPAEPEEEPASGSSWSSPFEWRPKASVASRPASATSPESAAASPEGAGGDHESAAEDRAFSVLAPEPSAPADEPSIAAADSSPAPEPSVVLPEPPVVHADAHGEMPEPAVDDPPPQYASVILPEPVAPPEPLLLNREPLAARPADPWAVEYGSHQVQHEEPTMVGYTAPFSAPPAEPIRLSESAMSPDLEHVGDAAEPVFEPAVAEPAAEPSFEPVIVETEAERVSDTLSMRTRDGEDELSRVSQELDLQLDDSSESTGADINLDADEPVVEISARDLTTDAGSPAIAIDQIADGAWPSDRTSETHEPAPVAPAPARRRSRSTGSSSSVLRLMPLAIWARAEFDKRATPAAPAEEAAPRSVNDELRDLMSRLALPPNIAGVSYARGVRIRRVRVPGGREARNGETPGPVILSKKALEEQRART